VQLDCRRPGEVVDEGDALNEFEELDAKWPHYRLRRTDRRRSLSQFAGRILIRESCGRVAQPSGNRVASPVGIASRFARAALMEKSMLGHAGFFTGFPKAALEGMIDVVKGVEPEMGYGAILKVSEAESNIRESRIRRTKTVCT
jgi:hypothetical protein